MKIFNYSFAMTKPHVLSTCSGPRTLLFFSLTLAFLLSLSGAQAFDCPSGDFEIKESQCLALKEIYNKTNGPMWKDKQGNPIWADGPRCGGYGVACSFDSEEKKYNVTVLALSGVGMSGDLPSFLIFSKLPFLEVIDMSQNSLTGLIPYDIRTLQFLRRLNFYKNNLTSSIPEELLGHNADTSFYLSIDLSYNNLLYTLPTDLGNANISSTS